MDRKQISSNSYPIHFCDDLLHKLPDTLVSVVRGKKILVCVTPTVEMLYGALLVDQLRDCGLSSVDVKVLDVSEGTKNVDSVVEVCSAAQAIGLGRRDVIIAFGGGVCSDVTRIAAALIRRGIGHICIPTTLIGQLDAAIGIKGGINFGGKKSYLGTFNPPEAVFIDPVFLASLGGGPIQNGLAEAIKLALSMDLELFSLIEAYGCELVDTRFVRPRAEGLQILERSIDLTLTELQQDLFERGNLQRVLDFGHTFSPLIEARSGYCISHGEAVAIDMCLSTSISVELGLSLAEDLLRVVKLISTLGLPCDSAYLDLELLRESLMAAAEHRGGTPNLVVPAGIGRTKFVISDADLTASLLERSLLRLRAFDLSGQAAFVLPRPRVSRVG